VGNSGGSSEPHLHAGWCELDATGRGTLRPMQITGLRTTGNLAVTGVPGTAVYLSGPQVIVEAEPTGAAAAPADEPPAVRCSIPTHAAMMRVITDKK
jgi:hypothetical protein